MFFLCSCMRELWQRTLETCWKILVTIWCMFAVYTLDDDLLETLISNYVYVARSRKVDLASWCWLIRSFLLKPENPRDGPR